MESHEQERFRQEQSAIQRSTTFVRAVQLKRLVDTLVDAAVEEREIDEYQIAVGPLRRRPDFDPAADAIVRKEMRRLRDRLARFYETEGIGREWQIALPPGSYRAVLRRRFRLYSRHGQRSGVIRIAHAGLRPAGFVDTQGWLSGVEDDLLTALIRAASFDTLLALEPPAELAPDYRLCSTVRRWDDATFTLRLRVVSGKTGRVDWQDESRYSAGGSRGQFDELVGRLETWAVQRRSDLPEATHAA